MKGGQYKKATYFNFIDKCVQDRYTSPCVFEESLSSLKMTFHWLIKFTAGMIMQLVLREQQS